MPVLAYNLSNNLQDHIKKVKLARKKLALLPIPPRDEVRLKWEAGVERIYWNLLLTEQDVSKNQIQKLFSSSKKKLTSQERALVNHKKAFTYIKEEWQATLKPVNFSAFRKLQSILNKGLDRSSSITGSKKKTIEHLITYLESSKEDPVIKAGIAQIQLDQIYPIEKGHLITGVIPYLFLYKEGYDFRELLVIEEFYRRDLVTFRNAKSTVLKNENLTLWLEYFSFSVFAQARKAYRKAESTRFSTDAPAKLFKLNERQKEILNMLDDPGIKIKNKDVRKKFNVSQITASRDLSELEDLGLLFKHGKGRSTYYTKV